MSKASDSMNEERSAPARFDVPAMRAAAVLAMCVGTLALLMYGAFIDRAAWQALALRGWVVVLLALPVAVVALAALDCLRRKNVSWRLLRSRFGQPLEEPPDRSNHGAGQGRFGEHTYWGVRSMGSKDGLVLTRVLGALNRPLHIPWAQIAAVEAYPNVLTGKRGFETDMGAKLTLRGAKAVAIEVPWLAEFRNLMPKSVRFRLVKLPAQG
jgi:hypothetical protein